MTLGVIGLLVLAQANAGSERLVDLQRRTAAYSDFRLEMMSQQYFLTKALAAPEPSAIMRTTPYMLNTSRVLKK